MFILRQKLFNKKNYSKRCDSCFHGRLTADSESVLCVKYGIMMPDHSCRDYKYDPLKRRPERQRTVEKFNADDFRL